MSLFPARTNLSSLLQVFIVLSHLFSIINRIMETFSLLDRALERNRNNRAKDVSNNSIKQITTIIWGSEEMSEEHIDESNVNKSVISKAKTGSEGREGENKITKYKLNTWKEKIMNEWMPFVSREENTFSVWRVIVIILWSCIVPFCFFPIFITFPWSGRRKRRKKQWHNRVLTLLIVSEQGKKRRKKTEGEEEDQRRYCNERNLWIFTSCSEQKGIRTNIFQLTYNKPDISYPSDQWSVIFHVLFRISLSTLLHAPAIPLNEAYL